MASAYRCFQCQALVPEGATHGCADPTADIMSRVEVRHDTIVVSFPGSADYAYLSTAEAQAWGEQLVRAAQASRLLATG
jgi:hypothetical protein